MRDRWDLCVLARDDTKACPDLAISMGVRQPRAGVRDQRLPPGQRGRQHGREMSLNERDATSKTTAPAFDSGNARVPGLGHESEELVEFLVGLERVATQLVDRADRVRAGRLPDQLVERRQVIPRPARGARHLCPSGSPARSAGSGVALGLRVRAMLRAASSIATIPRPSRRDMPRWIARWWTQDPAWPNLEPAGRRADGPVSCVARGAPHPATVTSRVCGSWSAGAAFLQVRGLTGMAAGSR